MSDQIRSPSVADERLQYEAPSFQCDTLALITLGGSPGAGDSGAENTHMPFGSSSGADFDDGTEENPDWEW